MSFRKNCVQNGRYGDSASDTDNNTSIEVFNFNDFSNVDGQNNTKSNDGEALFEGIVVVQ